MTEVDVAWTPTTLPDTTSVLRSRGASHAMIMTASRIKEQRKAIEEMRAEGTPPFLWLRSRPSQLATFYSLLGNWFDDRTLLIDAHGVDYRGGDQ